MLPYVVCAALRPYECRAYVCKYYMDIKKKRLPKICPSCGSVLRVRSMYCHACDTQIEGDYMLPPLMRLTEEEQRFVTDFVMCSGSLKEMAARMGVSYPSVRNRLDEIIGELRRAMSSEGVEVNGRGQ